MPIYDRPVRLLMKEMATDLRLGPDSVLTRAQVLDWFRQKYPKIKPATVSAHLIRMSTNATSRVHYNVSLRGEDDIFYQTDPGHFRLYNREKDPPPIYEKGPVPKPDDGTEPPDTDDVEGSESGSTFAYEKDLRSYLSKNLGLIEPGLRLYDEEGITGIEFPAGGRYIDILAVDRHNGLVVIELKVSRGYDRVVGQVLRYMGWIKGNLADANQAVRGAIVAREISEDLMMAASLVPGLSLFEYQMSVSLRRVHGSDT